MTIKKRNGFTLIEMVVVMLMLSITMAAFYSVYRMQTRSLKGQENRLEAQQTARSALDFMVREIRNAGYFPETVTDANCFAGQGGIQTADSQTFRFHYDFSPPDGDCGGGNEDIAFGYNNATKDITRAVNGGAPESLTDGNATDLTLAYFAQDGTPLTSFPLNAADRASIKRVNITVKVESKNMYDEFGGALAAEMTTNVDLRNRG